VPLSEDEQRILSEIEARLYESDPDLVRDIGETTLYRHAARNLKWWVLAFLAGFGMLLGTLHISYGLSVAGFLVMLTAAYQVERNLRRLGKLGWEQASQWMRAAGLRDYFGSTGQRMRDRFRRDD
jgi:hypothetical protein